MLFFCMMNVRGDGESLRVGWCFGGLLEIVWGIYQRLGEFIGG